jgi:hypothetical protein
MEPAPREGCAQNFDGVVAHPALLLLSNGVAYTNGERRYEFGQGALSNFSCGADLRVYHPLVRHPRLRLQPLPLFRSFPSIEEATQGLIPQLDSSGGGKGRGFGIQLANSS